MISQTVCLIIAGVLFVACQTGRSKESNELSAVREVLMAGCKAHFSKDVSLLISGMAFDTLVDVSGGLVKKLTIEECKNRFARYFNSVDFVKWDDISEPLLQ